MRKNIIRLQNLIDAMEQIAPLKYAENWDNVGLLVGDPEQTITGVMLCIDCTQAVIEEALAANCNVIIAYHPPIFSPLKRITAGNIIFAVLSKSIAIYSPHTALDSVQEGVNDVLANILELQNCMPLCQHYLSKESEPNKIGQGRIGNLSHATSRQVIIERIKQELNIKNLLICGPVKGDIKRIACLAGAGGEFLDDAITQGAELYLTGEIRHHDAIKAANAGMTVICTLHSHSERVILEPLKKKIIEKCPELSI